MKHRTYLAAMPVISSPVSWAAIRNVEGDLSDYFFRHIVDSGKREFLDKGRLRPMISVIGHARSATARIGRRRPQIYQHAIDISHMLATDDQREALGAVMPAFLTKVEGFCVVTATETWALIGPEVRTVYDRFASIGHHPDSFEALSFALETADGTSMELYPILREGDDVQLGDNCAPSDEPTFEAEGTFTNWLRAAPKGDN